MGEGTGRRKCDGRKRREGEWEGGDEVGRIEGRRKVRGREKYVGGEQEEGAGRLSDGSEINAMYPPDCFLRGHMSTRTEDVSWRFVIYIQTRLVTNLNLDERSILKSAVKLMIRWFTYVLPSAFTWEHHPLFPPHTPIA